jgi:hypothetical protein
MTLSDWIADRRSGELHGQPTLSGLFKYLANQTCLTPGTFHVNDWTTLFRVCWSTYLGAPCSLELHKVKMDRGIGPNDEPPLLRDLGTVAMLSGLGLREKDLTDDMLAEFGIVQKLYADWKRRTGL